jgi:DNA-binding MarR family transcriptional regulator
MTSTNGKSRRHAGVSDASQSPFRRLPVYLVRRLHQIFVGAMAEAFEGENFTPLQWAVIVHIDAVPGIDQSRLAEMVSIDKTSTGRIVDQLETASVVERSPNGTDRRAWMLRLTPLGKQVRRRLGPKAGVSQQRLLSQLSAKERQVLVELLVRVVEANESYMRPGAGRRKPRAQKAGPVLSKEARV